MKKFKHEKNRNLIQFSELFLIEKMIKNLGRKKISKLRLVGRFPNFIYRTQMFSIIFLENFRIQKFRTKNGDFGRKG